MPEGLSSAIRWSSISTLSRALMNMVFSLLIARMIGPTEFGIAAQAIVYVNMVGMFIDQGFSTALIQRQQLEPQLPGAVASAGLGIGVLLAGLTIAIAPLWASFMQTPELNSVVAVLATSFVIQSIALVPRAMLLRNFGFRQIAIADTTAVVSGGVLGFSVALSGGGYWAVVTQTLVTAAIGTLSLLALGKFYGPNLQWWCLRRIFAYSWRAFVANLLVNALTRNLDNLLIGRYQGPTALAYYALAYRTLLIPVQLAGTAVSSVLFPAFTRIAHDLPALAAELARATRTQATLWIPMMTLGSAAAPQVVLILFGSEWAQAIPIVQVLALAGSLQAVYQPTNQMLLATGRAELCLRFSWLTATFSAIGIVSGLPFGPIGVAAGYSIATLLLVPFHWFVRRSLLGATIRSQLAQLRPGCHVAVWTAGTYLLVALLIPGRDLIVLACGGPLAVLTGAAVLRVAHRASFDEIKTMIQRVLGRGRPGQENAVDG